VARARRGYPALVFFRRGINTAAEVIGAPRFVVEGADDPFAFCANHLGSPSMKNRCFGFGRLMLRQIRRRSICTMHSRVTPNLFASFVGKP
jgi:hypothetical protein